MNWVTVVWSMIAAACLTLAAIYLLVWFRNRAARAHLLFAVTAAAAAAVAFFELRLMQARTPDDVLVATAWAHVPLFVSLVSLVWFVRIHLGAGRLWLAWTITGLRAVVLLANVSLGLSAGFRNVTTLRHIEFLGESVTVLGAVRNPLTPIAQLATLLVLIFVADASVTAWRRGDRRKALMVGASTEFFLLASLGSASLILWADLQMPIAFSLSYLGLVAVMGYELSHNVLRASQLVPELRASEAELRESEARLSLAVDAADFGIWIWNVARNEVWASEKWRALFGFAPAAPLDYSAVLARLHPDDRDALERAHAMAMAGADDGRYQTDYRLLLPGGAIRWIASVGRVERDAGGQAVLIRGASREITASKQAERETQLLRHEIAHAGRVSMMGQLASSLAHEINQPLTAILMNATAGERFLRHEPPNLDEIRAILADIRTADERATAIIERMRGLLKRHTVDAQPLDAGALVGDVAALVRGDAAARQVKLEVDVPGDLPSVRGDRVHLQQVLLNLMLNGMDALADTTPADRRVRVSARHDGARAVEITVADTGPGMTPDTLAQIFTPFFTTKADGMGMGLAISRTIVEAHGGRLWAGNTAGGGAAFRFTLQVAGEGDT